MAKNWQETVKPKVIDIVYGNQVDITADLQAQAKATWEARQPEVAEAEQRGIRKVKEWVEEHHAIYPCQYGLDHYDDKGNEVLIHQKPCLHCVWQAFLKGVEK